MIGWLVISNQLTTEAATHRKTGKNWVKIKQFIFILCSSRPTIPHPLQILENRIVAHKNPIK